MKKGEFMNNLEVLRLEGQTKFIIPGLKGRLTIHDGGKHIAASSDHKKLLTRVDGFDGSYDHMSGCTAKDMNDVLIRIANLAL